MMDIMLYSRKLFKTTIVEKTNVTPPQSHLSLLSMLINEQVAQWKTEFSNESRFFGATLDFVQDCSFL